MKTCLALALCSQLAFAQAADAPVNPHPEGRSLHLEAGELVPFTGQLIQDTEHMRREWNNERTAGELARLKLEQGKRTVSVPVLVAIVAASLALGAAAGVGLAVATQKR